MNLVKTRLCCGLMCQRISFVANFQRASLCENGVLDRVAVVLNNFSGEVPVGLAKCRSLTRLNLNYNNLSGEVPAEFWDLPRDTISFLGNPELCEKGNGLFGCNCSTFSYSLGLLF